MKTIDDNGYNQPQHISWIEILSLPALVTAGFWQLRVSDILIEQLVCAFLVICTAWIMYLRWKRNSDFIIPFASIILSINFIYFFWPLFWWDRISPRMTLRGESIPEDIVTKAIFLVMLGMGLMLLGWSSGVGRRFVRKSFLNISDNQIKWRHIRIILILGIIISPLESFVWTFGGGWRQVLNIFQTMVPLIAFGLLFQKYLKGNTATIDKGLILAFLLIRFLIGLSSGWLGTSVSIFIICAILYISEKRRVPWVPVGLVLFLVFFFQVGKGAVREKYWYGQDGQGDSASQIERVTFWIEKSLERWGDAFSGSGGQMQKDLIYSSFSRLSILPQAANVVEMTPTVVPYQYGRLYSYLFITFIPRFIWPDKPSVNEANQFYQVAYELTAEENLDSVSIAVGYLFEGYISFGWIGVMMVMFLMGIFYDFFQRMFLARDAGVLLNCLGSVLVINLIGIESQLAQYLGGLAQIIAAIIIVLLPAIKWREAARLLRSPSPMSFREIRG